MHVINARGANDAWPQLIELIQRTGVPVDTRAGRALVIPEPVATVYSHPRERVLFDPVRDANPFFSLMEPLWMLAGRDDAQWLDNFIPSFSERFAEEGGRMHGAYGKRWIDWFPDYDKPAVYSLTGLPREATKNQLDECVRLLRDNPLDRQAVIQMWDPSADLGVPGLKDRPCNQQVLLRADRVTKVFHETSASMVDRPTLDITVTNRSNDLSWGLITANMCQFSTLHEYLAARMGYEVGTYTQMSNNLHLYESAMDKVDETSALEARIPQYPGVARLVDDPASFDDELRRFLEQPGSPESRDYNNHYFYDVARPVWIANEYRRKKLWTAALDLAEAIKAPDWREATVAWIQRRMK